MSNGFLGVKGIKLKVKYVALGLAVLILAYASLILLPYTGAAFVSQETRDSFAIDRFYGQQQTAERVMLLEDPQESFYHRINLVSQATHEIFFTSYKVNRGYTSDIFIGALLAAAERGVQVYMICNATFGSISSYYSRVLSAHENISLYLFNPFNLFQPQFINASMHDKYVLADNHMLILGGRNIGDRYFNPDNHEGNVAYDREVLVYNTDPMFNGAIYQVRNYFEEKRFSSRVTLQSRSTNDTLDSRKNHLISAYNAFTQGHSSFGIFDYYVNTIPAYAITLITNPVNTAKKESVVAFNLLMLAKNSSQIIAQSPYVVFTNRNMQHFADAVEGREVILSTNSLGSTPNLPAFANYHISRRRLLDTGITIYEFQSSNVSLHGKTYLFDGRLTVIGSFNMNERSIRSDTESVLVIDSPAFHDIVAGAIDVNISNSLRVNSSNTYDYREYVDPVSVTWGRRTFFTTIGWLIRPFRILS